MLRTQKHRRVSGVAVRPPRFRASKPACRYCGIGANDSPDTADVKYFFRNGLTFPVIVYTITGMEIEFDPIKDALNLKKHGLSLALARDLEWDEARIEVDTRYPYDEIRMNATVPLGNILYRVSFTERGGMTRVFSLRHANKKEVRDYVQNHD